MFAASMGAPAPVLLFGTDARTARLQAEHRRLAQAASNFVASHPRLIPLGDDPMVRQFMAAAGFASVDYHIMRVSVAGRVVTALCIPTRLWRDPEVRRLLLDVKRQSGALRTKCILVPQRWVRATVRASVALALARSRNVRYSRKELDAVIEHLRQVRIGTVMETASILSEHDDPVGAIFSMACQGLIDVDRGGHLTAETFTSIRP